MSVCTECDGYMTDQEARLNEVCWMCRKRGVPSHPVNHFAPIGRRMPKRKFEQHAPMPWQVAAMYATMQTDE